MLWSNAVWLVEMAKWNNLRQQICTETALDHFGSLFGTDVPSEGDTVETVGKVQGVCASMFSVFAPIAEEEEGTFFFCLPLFFSFFF